LIALFLTFAMAFSLVALPVVNAHYPPWTRPTWCYVSASPNPIGVNQQVLIAFWVDLIPPTASGRFGDRYTFWVEVAKPDNTNETLGPFTSDPVGGSYTLYTPTQVGTYTIQSRKDEITLTGVPGRETDSDVNDTVLGSMSDPVYLIVQEEQIQSYQETPLPTSFWTRPINGMNREWWQVASNWVSTALQTNGSTTNFGWGTGPETAHIMWTHPIWAGGIIDERFGDISYSTGMSYEDFHDFTDLLIIDGKVYYNVGGPPQAREGWYAVNLYTGETEFFHNTTGPIVQDEGFDDSGKYAGEWLSFGQIFDYESPNQHGGFAYLWSTYGPAPNTWMMFDASTGNYICSIGNVSSGGTAFVDKIGSICRLSLATTAGVQYLRIWNTTEAIWFEPEFGSYPPRSPTWETTYPGNYYWMWRPDLTATFDGRNGFSMNVSLDGTGGRSQAIGSGQTSIRAVVVDEFVIGGSAGDNNEDGVEPGVMWCLSLKRGDEGKLLWNRTFTPPSSAGNNSISGPVVDPEDGVFFFECTRTRQRWCYNLETMQLMWGPTAPEDQWLYYGMDDVIYQGKLFSFGYGGVLTAYDIQTGQIVWNYSAGTLGFEQPYSGAQLSLGCVADGKLYFYSTEHSSTVPLARGQYVRCINASNGAELWKITNWASRCFAIADGYIVTLNHFDMQLYCYGKGPTATTVTASPKASVHGNSVLVEGTVVDTAAGTEQYEQAKRFPNGVPAMSDADMSAWMEHVYMQRPIPSDAKGVEVVLSVLDPNGNYYEVGRTTSDASGMFSCAFTPEVPGKYTIIATFEGSKSYYASYAETAINVEEAPAATPAPTPTPVPMTDMYVMGFGIGIIIAVVVVGLLLVLLLRKR
jgi:hypothetical protein